MKNKRNDFLIHTNFLTEIAILLFQKGVYTDEYRDDCKRLNENLLSEKEDFYSHLNMRDIIDIDYAHPKRVFKDLVFSNVCENVLDMCLKIYKLGLAKFLLPPG